MSFVESLGSGTGCFLIISCRLLESGQVNGHRLMVKIKKITTHSSMTFDYSKFLQHSTRDPVVSCWKLDRLLGLGC